MKRAAVLFLCAAAAAWGQQSLEEVPAADLPPAEIAGEIPSERISARDTTGDWPALAAADDGTVWAAWVEWDGADSDRVLVRRRAPSGAWGAAAAIADGRKDHYLPAIAAVPGGAVVAWSAQVDGAGGYDLFAAHVSPNGEVGAMRTLSAMEHGDFHVRLAADSQGSVTAVWQSFGRLNADIFARRLSGGVWGPTVRVSTSEASDWEPAVALDSAGKAWISWDTYHAGNYDVLLASFDGAKASAPVVIASGPQTQFHSSLAVDSADRVWVAYDTARPNWGKDYSTSSAVEGSEGLHARRGLAVRVYANGRVFEPKARMENILSGRMSRFAELPTMAIDGGGSPWLIFRHWTIRKPHEMFHVYASRLAESGWTKPVILADSAGRNTQRTAVAVQRGGSLLAAYASDLRSPDNLPQDQEHALHYNIYLARLDRGESGGPALQEVRPAALEAGFEPRRRAQMTVGGKTYTLLLGDCHRHTDVRGHSGVDGSTEDTYRYAIDAAQLDFVGPSDHNAVLGGRWPDSLRDYQWRYNQKLVDVYTHAPRFWGIYAYEHSMQRPGGHRNILFLKRGAPLRMIDREKGLEAADNQPPVLWDWAEKNVLTQDGQKLVIVPHTFAAGPLADWNWPNSPFDCLLEIYQGARGSYEKWRLPKTEIRGGTQTDDPGHFAADALDRGHLYGFVSFSDHRSTHNSWAAVWAEQETREALFDAMLARRTYAASDEIILKVSAGGRNAGERFTASAGAPPEIAVAVEAPDEILRVDVVKNGEYVYTRRPGGRSVRLAYRDAAAAPGDSYYYVRVFQRDPENPTGDPEIAWSSPFFVQYE